MRKIFQLILLPSEAASDNIISNYLAEASGEPQQNISGFTVIKRSIDARGRQAWIILVLEAFINEPYLPRKLLKINFRDVNRAEKKVIIIGAGPAGLFAALKLLEKGIKPVILERGKDVRARRRDLAVLNKEGILNPESNYCFGEGGAGTYSDGKLYTRSTKRGDINRILNLMVQFGAEENILFDAHPHIGTNKLPQIITSIRQQIVEAGGLFSFEKKVVDIQIEDDLIKGVRTADGDFFESEAVILATGHSARDIFQLLHKCEVEISFKPFALGVRIEHPQDLLDRIQYHCHKRDSLLPPASYNFVEQVEGRSAFSFCMCPGGIIAPACTSPGELVVNGWSPSKRNNPFGNSGIVVGVEEKDVQVYQKKGPLAGMHFQRSVEEKAFNAGGGKYIAPAQRMVDFVNNKISSTLPACSYLPGIHSASLEEILPDFVSKGLRQAFKGVGKKMKDYYTNEGVLVATESRTSSPVRIPRDRHSLQHPRVRNLFPCGEGAGFAGGIVSAAMDGERVASQIAAFYNVT